ncbi:MAG: hypothetical protein RIG82_05925 [Phycisphaeraceae bacterium]
MMLVLAQMFGFSSGDSVPIVLGLAGMGFALAVVLTTLITKAVVASTRVREEAALKALMLERGASVEEIERVLRATAGEKEKS